MKEKSFCWFVFAICINFVISQVNEFKVGEVIEDTITKRKFYRAELTNRTADYLIISVTPSNDYEKYSDPDIFVSQVLFIKLEKLLPFEL